MARSPRRITRRDIRKPDQFVTLTGEVLHFVSRYRNAFIISLSLVVVGLLGLWGWEAYRQRQNRLAAVEYSRAVDLYHGGKYLQAIELFGHVRGYSSSPYSRLSILYQANSYLALEDSKKAAGSLTDLLQRERKETYLRQLGLLTFGYLQEKAGNCKEAGSNFAAAEKITGPFKDEALLAKARCSLQTQDPKGALDSYRQYLTSYPGSERAGEISLKIQEIEGKLAAGGGK